MQLYFVSWAIKNNLLWDQTGSGEDAVGPPPAEIGAKAGDQLARFLSNGVFPLEEIELDFQNTEGFGLTTSTPA
jgi:hypothetical protein